MQSPTYLNWHLGLGDAFICNGLVRALLKRGRSLILPVKPQNVEAVGSMFGGLTNLQLLPIHHEHPDWRATEAACKVLGIGYLGLGYKTDNRFVTLPWDLEFYHQAALPTEDRWRLFDLPARFMQRTPAAPDFAFVHDDPDRGYCIDARRMGVSLPCVFPDRRQPIHGAAMTMCDAKEIHCIDSSMLNLAEGLNALGALKATRFVFHRYARPGGHPPGGLRAPWEILE